VYQEKRIDGVDSIPRIPHISIFPTGRSLRLIDFTSDRTRSQTNQMTALAAIGIIGASLVGLQLYWTRNENLSKVGNELISGIHL